MSKNLQVRDLDDEVVAELKARAARAQQSLSAYAGRILTEAASHPTPDDLLERLKALRELGGGASHEDVMEEIRRIRET
ncbi:FitA-like ribbon-helix-helix domain-containing protein [Glycomyces xiaoerkulensis]|uniref:FitA-like ribbon-helix-helix domain-containing protein n=1 Tax=Glycomyces xiaoerkulensis TaxID=2038139 RepID=UPI001300064F|nr:antitoxin [Glycomyces xiaoerkulensis]